MIDCNLIRDLLPLYIDGLCSPETGEQIKAHLAACPSCQREYEQMKAAPRVPVADAERKTFAEGLKTLTRKLTLKHLRNLLIAAVVLCVIALDALFAADRLLWRQDQVLPVEAYQVELAVSPDGQLHYRQDFMGKSYTGCTRFDRRDGVLYIWYQTPVFKWSNHTMDEGYSALQCMEQEGAVYEIDRRTINQYNILGYVAGAEISQIRQGTPEGESRLLYARGDALPAIDFPQSAEMVGASVIYLESGEAKLVLESMNGEKIYFQEI